MRLKENYSNWRASAVEKRDFKHDHSEPVVIFRSTKPTNRWCRGKNGINHIMHWQDRTDLFEIPYQTGGCSNCGKTMFRKTK